MEERRRAYLMGSRSELLADFCDLELLQPISGEPRDDPNELYHALVEKRREEEDKVEF